MRWWQRRDDPHVGLQGFLEMLSVEDISKFTAAHDRNQHESNDDPCRPHACVSQNWYPSQWSKFGSNAVDYESLEQKSGIKNAADLVNTSLCELFLNWASKNADESASNWINIIIPQLEAAACLKWNSSELLRGELNYSQKRATKSSFARIWMDLRKDWEGRHRGEIGEDSITWHFSYL